MDKQRSTGEIVFDYANVIFLFLLGFIMLYPFMYVLFSAVSIPSELIGHRGILLWPKGFQVEAFRLVFMNPMITYGYINTIIYLVFGLVINLFLTILSAYALSRQGVMLRRFFSLFIVFTMFFQGGLIPLFLQVNGLGLLDTRLALILPSAMSAYNLIIMRTGFEAVPISLEESAKLDGANHMQICFQVILPLSTPVVAVVALYYGVYHWNAWYHAFLFLQDRGLYPLQLILREILIVNSTDAMTAESGLTEVMSDAVRYAAILVATVPILCIYPFLQRFFVKGIMIGAVKG
jgi:putative aldouronate transport system permease protein